MPRLIVFNAISLDGYFTDAHGDMSWAHKDDAEWGAFAAENAGGGGTLLFGRVTYDMMASYWPTPMAMQGAPMVAERMNNLQKVVFSRTMGAPTWANTKLLKGDIAAEVRRMKDGPGADMAILGSGTIVSQLAQAGLIDEYQLVVNPIALGSGRTMFEGLIEPVHLKLIKSRTFSNGNVVLWYEPLH